MASCKSRTAGSVDPFWKTGSDIAFSLLTAHKGVLYRAFRCVVLARPDGCDGVHMRPDLRSRLACRCTKRMGPSPCLHAMQRQCIEMAGLLLLAMVAADAASAETDYPNSPVRVISDSGPGGAVNTGLRIIADGMSRYWKQQVVIVNQPGAAGSISATVASQAAPDGYTLYAPALSLFLAVPGKAPNLPLMVPRDFAAVGYGFEQLLAIAVSPKLGIKTLQELVDLAR